jgi:gliding motility-associated-like protein
VHYGGVNPTFEWFVNGQSSGSGNVFSPGVLSNSDSVSVQMTSSVPCAIQPIVNGSFLINNFPSPIADFTYSNPAEGAFLNQLSFLNTSINANSWVWYFRADSDTSFSRNPVHEFPGQGTYEVTLLVGNNYGCFDSVTYNVIVEEAIAVFLPKAFSPNGDNMNELFQPIGASLTEYEFSIYNRWGQVIFVGNEKKPWNGNVKDSSVPAPEGVYVYHLEAKGLDLDKGTVNGRVTLIR